MNSNTSSLNQRLIEAAANGDTEAAISFLSSGANINAKDENERTALIHATYNCHVETIKLLIERGADLDAKDREGWTALRYAEEMEDKESASLLKKAALTVIQSPLTISPTVEESAARIPFYSQEPPVVDNVNLADSSMKTDLAHSRDWRDAVIIGSLIGGAIIIGLVLVVGPKFTSPAVTTSVNSNTRSSSSPNLSSSSRKISEGEAASLIRNWLQVKSQIFAPPFNRELAGKVTTDVLYRDITKSGGSIDWLRNNNAFYRFGVQNVETTGQFASSGDRATIEVIVTEERSLYVNGRRDETQTGFNSKRVRYSLQLSNGLWKIADYQTLD